MFLYYKYNNDPIISFKYSEIKWMSWDLANKILHKTDSLGLIKLVEEPTKKKPIVVCLRTNEELQYLININKKIEFEKYTKL